MHIIESLLNWPFVVLVLSISFMILFKKQIERLITRVKSFTKNGFEMQGLEKEQVDNTKQSLKYLERSLKSQLLRETEDNIRKEMTEAGYKNLDDCHDLLIQRLAVAQMAYVFEVAYNSIFGSQIRVLKMLNENRIDGMTKEQLTNYYEIVKNASNGFLDDYNLDNYLGYLFMYGFLGTKDSRYFITVRGAEFLSWMAALGKSENKPI
ncbi:MAG: hypothetical protein V2A56_11740 [bacterium]